MPLHTACRNACGQQVIKMLIDAHPSALRSRTKVSSLHVVSTVSRIRHLTLILCADGKSCAKEEESSSNPLSTSCT